VYTTLTSAINATPMSVNTRSTWLALMVGPMEIRGISIPNTTPAAT